MNNYKGSMKVQWRCNVSFKRL